MNRKATPCCLWKCWKIVRPPRAWRWAAYFILRSRFCPESSTHRRQRPCIRPVHAFRRTYHLNYWPSRFIRPNQFMGPSRCNRRSCRFRDRGGLECQADLCRRAGPADPIPGPRRLLRDRRLFRPLRFNRSPRRGGCGRGSSGVGASESPGQPEEATPQAPGSADPVGTSKLRLSRQGASIIASSPMRFWLQAEYFSTLGCLDSL